MRHGRAPTAGQLADRGYDLMAAARAV